jgi:hypothetical protein
MRRKIEVPCPDRVRRAERFGWVDQELLLGGYLGRLSAPSQGLYLFLCLAANREGVSWYSDLRLRELTRLSAAALESARRELVDADLVAFASPYYQVLSLPRQVLPAKGPAASTSPALPPATPAQVAAAIAAIRRNLQGGE